jgi:hypothetical protein
MHRAIVVVLFVLALGACAQPTPYQPAREGYGFTQQRLEDNRYRIVFRGNNVTPPQVVEDYMLYRAAELTLEKDFDYFVVADKNLDKSTQYFATFNDTGFPYYGPYYSRRAPPPYWYGPRFESGTYRPIERFTATANIVLHRGTKPEDVPEAYDAREVIARLGPTIRYPAPANP